MQEFLTRLALPSLLLLFPQTAVLAKAPNGLSKLPQTIWLMNGTAWATLMTIQLSSNWRFLAVQEQY